MVQGEYIDGIDISADSSHDSGANLGFTIINHPDEFAEIMQRISEMAAAASHCFKCGNENDGLIIMMQISEMVKEV